MGRHGSTTQKALHRAQQPHRQPAFETKLPIAPHVELFTGRRQLRAVCLELEASALEVLGGDPQVTAEPFGRQRGLAQLVEQLVFPFTAGFGELLVPFEEVEELASGDRRSGPRAG